MEIMIPNKTHWPRRNRGSTASPAARADRPRSRTLGTATDVRRGKRVWFPGRTTTQAARSPSGSGGERERFESRISGARETCWRNARRRGEASQREETKWLVRWRNNRRREFCAVGGLARETRSRKKSCKRIAQASTSKSDSL